MIDTHTHSIFSADGYEKMEDIIIKSIDMGLTYIAISDHLDRDYLYINNLNNVPQLDTDVYYDTLLKLKDKYREKIKLGIGLEVGYSRKSENDSKLDIDKYPYDIIINSVHTVNEKDPYYGDYFGDMDKIQSYGEYLKCIRESLDASYLYHTVGHIGYVSRYGPYQDKTLRYEEFKEQIDDILISIIDKDKTLEVNTNAQLALTTTLPNYNIIKRYKELGGEKITYASDAHRLIRICDKYNMVCDMLSAFNFKYLTYFYQGKEYQHKI